MSIFNSKEEKILIEVLKNSDYTQEDIKKLLVKSAELKLDLSILNTNPEKVQDILKTIADSLTEDDKLQKEAELLKGFGFSYEEAIELSKQFKILNKDILEFKSRKELESFYDVATGVGKKIEDKKSKKKKSINSPDDLIIKKIREALLSKDPAKIIQAGRDLMSYGKSKL